MVLNINENAVCIISSCSVLLVVILGPKNYRCSINLILFFLESAASLILRRKKLLDPKIGLFDKVHVPIKKKEWQLLMQATSKN